MEAVTIDPKRKMPTKAHSKSIDNINRKIAKYELMALYVQEHIRGCLRYAWSFTLVDDFEFIITTLTLLRLNMIPRDIKHVRTLYKKYSKVGLKEL